MIISRRTMLGLLPAASVAVRALAQEPAPVRLRRFFSATGGYFVIEPDGRVKVWTALANVTGAKLGLGHDRVVPEYVAQEVPALRGATRIAGGAASYAVMADGRLLAWESNWSGLLGNTSLAEFERTAQPHPPVPTPTPTLPMPKIVDVAAGSTHVVALTADGTVFAWGNAQAGQLGIGELPVINFKTRAPDTTYYVPFPTQVPGLSDVAAIAAGSKFSLALLKDGSIRAWGENQYGQLGDGTTQNRLRPVAVRGITNAVAVSAGGLDYCAALLADGTVMTWGQGNGALGRPVQRGSANPLPTRVAGVSGVTAIAAGAFQILGLTGAGRVLSWGDGNVFHPVGHPGTASTTPAFVTLPMTARAVFTESQTSVALLADGTFMVWGALPSLVFRVDGANDGSIFPVPMVVKGL